METGACRGKGLGTGACSTSSVNETVRAVNGVCACECSVSVESVPQPCVASRTHACKTDHAKTRSQSAAIGIAAAHRVAQEVPREICGLEGDLHGRVEDTYERRSGARQLKLVESMKRPCEREIALLAISNGRDNHGTAAQAGASTGGC